MARECLFTTRGAAKVRIVISLVVLFAATAVAVTLVLLYAPSKRPENLLLITVDTLRPDHLGCYGYPKIETPNVDALAGDGVVFDKAVASAPLTTPSHASILTGFYPQRHGIRDNFGFKLAENCPTLAEILHRKGYATGAVVSAATLASDFGLNRGFDFYDETFTRLAIEAQRFGDVSAVPPNNEKTAAEATDIALSWLERNSARKFFLWIHYFDPHAAYKPPEPFRSRYADAPYDGEIAYVDDNLARLIHYLRQRGLETKTAILFTADHGEGLGEHGEKTHGLFIYDSTILVPLIFKAPGFLPQGKVCDRLARTVDIVPTILDMLAAEPSSPVHGESLLPAMLGKQEQGDVVAYCENFGNYINFGWSRLRSLTTDRWKYIATARPELYDIRSDAHENDDLVERQTQTAAEMRRHLQSLLRELSADTMEAAAANLRPDIVRQLRGLGYVGGSYTSELDAALDADSKLSDAKDMVGVVDEILVALATARTGQCEKALEMLKHIAEKDPGNLQVLRWIGGLSAQAGDYDNAIKTYKTILKMHAADRNARLELGKALMNSHAYDEALSQYDKVLKKEAENPAAHLGRASTLYRMARFQEAEKEYQTALELQAGYTEAVIGLAYLYAHMDRPSRGIALLQDAILHSPNNPDLHRSLAEIYRDMGKMEEAEKELRLAIELAPQAAEAYLDLAGIYLDTARHENALSPLRKALEILPRSSEAHHKMGKFYFYDGNMQAAFNEYMTAIRLNPRHSEYYNDLGVVQHTVGRYRDAVESYMQAIRLNKHNPQAHHNLGASYFALRRFPEAEAHLKIAVSLKPDDVQLLLDLARVYIKQQILKQAILVLNQALKIEPGNGEARDLLQLAEEMREKQAK